MERRNQQGVYCIFTSMEMGSTFQSRVPKFPTDDPDYRIIRRVPSRYLHYYFYIRDPVVGPLGMCIGTWLLGPKFSEKDRRGVSLKRGYSINQIEYCRNFIFKRHFPIHRIFEHSCEMGLFRLAADKVAYIFGVRVNRRLRGKLHSVLERLDHGHHVMRIYCRNLVGRMYEKFSTFLRLEICVNRMKDLGLNKGQKNLEALRRKLAAVTDRLAAFEAQSLNVHVDFPLFQRIALPVIAGKTKIAGIKIHDTRMMRLMEVLLHGGTQLNG
jgi:hypothetical protein